MDLKKNKLNKIKRQTRHDSTSSNTSSSKSKNKSFEAIVKFEYGSDNSTCSDSVTLNLESSNSSSKASPLYIPKNKAAASIPSHARIKFLKKAKSALNAKRTELSCQSEELMHALSKCRTANGYHKDVLLELCGLEDSSSDDDEDNVPSTSTGRDKKWETKYSTKANCNSESPASKRKRRLSEISMAFSDKDSDFGYEQPLAKRQQRVPSIYQSQPTSVASSVYPSPLDELLDQDIDTESNTSKGNSTDIEYDNVGHNGHSDDNTTIPDSPNSLDNNSEDSEESSLNKCCPHDDCGEDCTNLSLEEEVVSHINSPYPGQFRRSTAQQHHGERTPAQSLLVDTNCNKKTEPERPKVISFEEYANSYNCMTPAAETDPPRQCPLPALSWANAHDVWQTMCKKDEEATCLRDSGMLDRHPGLQPRMRAILLDWLIEVCEVYKLHRETYYLAVDYLDRYLTAKFRVQKTHLQLIGITCLFVAAKVEEIYPPKIGEFAYVTDGACQEADILHNEILLLQALDWDINPVTPMGWLGVYMQLNVNSRTPKTLTGKREQIIEKENKPKIDSKTNAAVDDAFIYPQFSGFEFVQTAQLLDLCSLDVGVAHFSYSVLAAAAMSHTFNKETALRCSGLDWQTISPCARWMEPFFTVIALESEHLYVPEQNDQVSSKFGLGHICSNISTDDSHIIQTHAITMGMFDRVTQIQEQLITIKPEASPAIGLICPDGLLTPPASSRKPLDIVDDDHKKTITKTSTSSTTTTTTPSSEILIMKNLQGNNVIEANKKITTAIEGVDIKASEKGTTFKKT